MYENRISKSEPVLTRNNVRAVVYDLKDGKHVFLLLKARKGYWQNPQGGIDNGESELEALVRETREETGLENIQVHENTRFKIDYFAERQGLLIYVKLAAYAVKADSNSQITLFPEEGHTESRWVDHDTAIKMLDRYPEQAEAFRRVYEKLTETENE
jgi:8-oxo-dGTP pyrophosphatase MutT (NUDIX family)